MPFIQRLGLHGLLSFPPGMEPFELLPLNVLIGPNGAGKSNVIEACELLGATPTNLASAIRDGGGAAEWIWKGEGSRAEAEIDVEIGGDSNGSATPTGRPLRYRLGFGMTNNRLEVMDEAVEETTPDAGYDKPYFYYRFERGRPVLNVKGENQPRHLQRENPMPDQSVLTQRKDPDIYPEVAWIGQKFGEILTFREWGFGRYAPLRQPQPADLPDDRLMPDNRNLSLVLNRIENRDRDFRRFNDLLRRFYSRFERMSTRVSGGAVQFYLHEPGLASPIPAARLSDGTIRFLSILALLLAPAPPPLVCIEEPELGLHPDVMRDIGRLLIEASARMQLIVTTHSDALVSALSDHPESVVVCERRGAATALERLDRHRLSSWLDRYTLGDLWRDGELGGNP